MRDRRIVVIMLLWWFVLDNGVAIAVEQDSEVYGGSSQEVKERFARWLFQQNRAYIADTLNSYSIDGNEIVFDSVLLDPESVIYYGYIGGWGIALRVRDSVIFWRFSQTIWHIVSDVVRLGNWFFKQPLNRPDTLWKRKALRLLIGLLKGSGRWECLGLYQGRVKILSADRPREERGAVDFQEVYLLDRCEGVIFCIVIERGEERPYYRISEKMWHYRYSFRW